MPAAAGSPAPHWVPIEPWVVFGIAVAVLLTLDLLVFHRKAHEPTLCESAY